MSHTAARCPDCGASVSPTIGGNICGHLEPTRRSPCIGSFKRWELAVHAPAEDAS